MKNMEVGIMLVGVSAVIGFIIYSFNKALTDIVATSCSHGSSCPMWGTIEFQTNVSLSLMALVAVIGAYLIFFGREQAIVVRKVEDEAPRQIDREGIMKKVADMGDDARKVLDTIISSEGTVFQAEIVAKTGLSKVKVTRVLDRLEGRGLVDRKRRGMTNVVILKH